MRHKITQSHFHKGYVFLFSRVEDPEGMVETAGLWSTHKVDDDENKGGAYYAQKFQSEHDRQCDFLFDKHRQSCMEEKAAEGLIIDDRTEESQQLLKKRK